MTMDDKYFEDVWNSLKNSIQKILKKDTSQISTEEQYR